MMNHDLKIPLQWRDHHPLGYRTQTILKKMSAPNGALADDNSLRVQQIHEISDPQSQIPTHLFEDPLHRFVARFCFGDDGLYQAQSLIVVEWPFRNAKTGLRRF